MGMEVSGRVHHVGQTEHVSDRFSKRVLVVELVDNPKYPQLVAFEASGDRVNLLDNIGEGDEVRVEFSLRGREWRSPKGEVKWFNTLSIWKVEIVKAAARQKPTGGGGDEWGTGDPNGPDNGLPFTRCDAHDNAAPTAWSTTP